jgi:4-hydroxy-4-methyl-2-oxoglutarate aldolase
VADQELAARLAALACWDTPAVSNALDRLAIRPRNGGFDNCSLRQLAGSTMCGVVVTAQLRAREPGDDAVAVADLYRAIIDAPAPAIVVVEDLDNPPGGGAFLGEVIGTFLARIGVVGFVTNGRVRDAAELRASGISVHASGLCVARSYVRLCAVNAEVSVAGLTLAAGEILHGDEHGLLQIPRSAVAALPELAEQIRASEQDTIAWANSPQFSNEALLARPAPPR